MLLGMLFFRSCPYILLNTGPQPADLFGSGAQIDWNLILYLTTKHVFKAVWGRSIGCLNPWLQPWLITWLLW